MEKTLSFLFNLSPGGYDIRELDADNLDSKKHWNFIGEFFNISLRFVQKKTSVHDKFRAQLVNSKLRKAEFNWMVKPWFLTSCEHQICDRDKVNRWLLVRTFDKFSTETKTFNIAESKNLTFNTRNSNGLVENQLFLAHGKLEVQAKSFRVLDSNRTTLLYVEGDGIEIGAEKLKVKDEVTFKDSIQTNCLKAEPGKDLK